VVRRIEYGDVRVEVSEQEYLEFLVGGVESIYNIAAGVFSKAEPQSGFFDIRGTQRPLYYQNLKDALPLIDLLEDAELQRLSRRLVQQLGTIEQLHDRFITVIAEFLQVPWQENDNLRGLAHKVNRYAERHGPMWVQSTPYKELFVQVYEAREEAACTVQAIRDRKNFLLQQLGLTEEPNEYRRS
jgi:hypothetical protein